MRSTFWTPAPSRGWPSLLGALFLLISAAVIGAPAWAISIPCGTSIDAAVAANPPGTVFQLAANCTYSGQTFRTKDSIQLIGAGAGSTIIDGGHADIAMTNGAPPYGGDGTTGVIIDGVTIQNYGPDTAENTSSQFYTWNGWIVRNSTITGAGGTGINLVGSATLTNSLITGNREIGVSGDLGLAGAQSPTTITGNEISNNNTRLDNPDNSASGVKMVGNGASVVVTNNYFHDNLATGLWFDIGVAGATIQGNTIIHNSYNGIQWEVSNGPADISGNVVNDNAWDSRMPSVGAGIFVSSAAGAKVYNNNVRALAAQGYAILLLTQARSDQVVANNDTFRSNTVTFLGSAGQYGWLDFNAQSITGTFSNNNSFFVVNTGDSHFFWNSAGTTLPFATYKTNTGQDAASTITAGNGSVPGCLMKGCTGSGWPLPLGSSTTINVPITITHGGGPLTTFTFVNDSGATLPAGTPVSFGQGFRYGDVMPGTVPLIRDASTHVALAGQQWDEISTWCQHTPGGSCTTGALGFNGSWRHAVWAIWLPNSLAPGATYTIEFIAASGTTVQFGTPNPSLACAASAGALVTTLALAGGDGQPVTWSLSGDTADFATSGSSVVVGPSGINPAHCGQTNNVTVTGTQS